MSTTNFEEHPGGAIKFRHNCGGRFPVEISIDRHSNGRIDYAIAGSGWGHTASCSPGQPEENGKLTGMQLRTIAAKDQLEALLEDRLFDAVKLIAEANQESLTWLLHAAGDREVAAGMHEDDPDPVDILKAISAMALFCYTEMVERGLKKPGMEAD